MALVKSLTDKARKSVATVAIKQNSTGNILMTPIAATGTLDTGINIAELSESNCRGEQVRAAIFKSEEKPKLQLEYGIVTPLMNSLKLDRTMSVVTGGNAEYYKVKFRLPAVGNSLPANSAGVFGNGLAGGDVSATAGVSAFGKNEYGLSEAVTIAATAAPTDTTTIAIGADGALTFSDDLQNADINLLIPYTGVDFAETGSVGYGELSVRVKVINLDLTVTEWVYPKVQVDPSGSIPFGGDSATFEFFINGDYTYRSYALTNDC